MKKKPFLVTYEDETRPMRIARQGSEGYLTVKKLMDQEDTGSVSGVVLVLKPYHISSRSHLMDTEITKNQCMY